MRTRAEHLAWCKERATELANEGDLNGAVTSMLSDIGKHDETQMDGATSGMLMMSALMGNPTQDSIKHWIEGFN